MTQLTSTTQTPDYRLQVNGSDITPTLNGRMISLTLTDNRGDKADQFDLVLSDHDGQLAIPPRGAVIQLWLGFKGELVDKGSFTVDETSHSGTPDKLTIRARSADLRGSLKVKREQSWHQVRIDALVNTLAKRHGLQPMIGAELADTLIEHIDQTHESDISFLTRLGKQYDAIATVKAGRLLFMPSGSGSSASGQPIPAVTLTRNQGDQHHYQLADRDSRYSGVIAYWQDNASAERQQKYDGDVSSNSATPKVLRTPYPNASEAQQAATAEWQRIQRQGASFNLTLATGNPALYPETPIKARGWKKEIDETEWLLTKVVHSLSDGGYTGQLEMVPVKEG